MDGRVPPGTRFFAMPNSAEATNLVAGSRDAAAIDGLTSTPRVIPLDLRVPSTGWRTLRGAWGRIGDKTLAYVVSAVLFVLFAWPLALTEVPPFQDLPNHLAAVSVIEHPQQYPEFVFNGFLKTNAALFAWLYVVGKLVGAKMAARLFALVVIAANALVLPRFVLVLTKSRAKMLVASLLLWPMVHNWFVSTGMLDFALAVPLSLGLLLSLDVQRRTPTVANGLRIVLLGALTWYAHVFPLLIVHMLALLEVARGASWEERKSAARRMAIPLLPITLLVLASLVQHLRDSTPGGLVEGARMLPFWELAYNMWAEWLWGFSKLTLSSLVPCLVLAGIGLWRWRESPAFFSPLALVALGLLYVFLPYIITNWFHVNSRIVPYLWIAFVVRVPERLPKRWIAVLATAAGLYSVGMGVDYVRLERERREFIAGIDAVPTGARLLPLMFRQKGLSENTRSIMHMWGYYVTDKETSAPLLFAHSHSFPVMYSTPPPVRFNHLVLEGFAPSMAQPETICRTLIDRGITVDDCEALYRATWREFWNDATPRFDHLLVWDATPEARASIPAAYERTFAEGRLEIYARKDVGRTAAVTR